jgi:hypothetical protein
MESYRDWCRIEHDIRVRIALVIHALRIRVTASISNTMSACVLAHRVIYILCFSRLSCALQTESARELPVSAFTLSKEQRVTDTSLSVTSTATYRI